MYPANEKSPKGKVTTETAAAVQWGLVVLLSGFAWFTNQNNAYLSYTGPWCSRCAWQESDIDSHWHHRAQKRKKSFQSSLRFEVLARGDFLLMHWTHYLNLWLCLVSATISVTVWRAKLVPFNGFTPQKKKQTCVSVMKRFILTVTCDQTLPWMCPWTNPRLSWDKWSSEAAETGGKENPQTSCVSVQAASLCERLKHICHISTITSWANTSYSCWATVSETTANNNS